MPNKPGKYGMLIRTMADANHRYMRKMWPYRGRPAEAQQSPPDTDFETVPEMVKYMVQELAGTGWNVAMDRIFTSVPLAGDMLTDRLTGVGTINKRRNLISKELTCARGRQPDTTPFMFRNEVTLVSRSP